LDLGDYVRARGLFSNSIAQTAKGAEQFNTRCPQEAVLIGFMPCLVASIVQAAPLYLGQVIYSQTGRFSEFG